MRILNIRIYKTFKPILHCKDGLKTFLPLLKKASDFVGTVGDRGKSYSDKLYKLKKINLNICHFRGQGVVNTYFLKDSANLLVRVLRCCVAVFFLVSLKR
jgi:hypothetical protein